jgi:hypothetical protein
MQYALNDGINLAVTQLHGEKAVEIQLIDDDAKKMSPVVKLPAAALHALGYALSAYARATDCAAAYERSWAEDEDDE